MHILVVDDSKIIRIMIIRILNELGYDQIMEAADVDSAFLKMQMQKPDLILSDFNMPGKSGIDFLRIVRQDPIYRGIPFMLVTTVHDKKIIVEAVKLGLQYYILKPVEKKVFSEKLTALAETYNFQPPAQSAKKAAVAAEAEASPSHVPEAGTGASKRQTGISEEQIDLILNHFFLVFDGEMTIPDFLAWSKEQVVAALPESSELRDPQQLLNRLRDAALQGMQVSLRQLAGGS